MPARQYIAANSVAISKRMKAVLTSATGAAVFTILGIVTKQKKFIRWSVGQVISKAKAQRQPN